MRSFLLTALLLCAGCATTKFKSTWTEPGSTPLRWEGHRVLAMVQALDERWGPSAERALARQLHTWGVIGVPAYTVISDAERADPQKLAARLDALSIAGAVVVRVAYIRAGHPAVAPAFVGTTHAGGYYDAWYDGSWSEFELNEPPPRGDTKVYIDTHVYRAEGAELVWTGESRSRNPTNVDGLMEQLARATATELRRAGLIAQ
jgi:hypothetical protein